jgi:hypothetical protein
MKHKEQSTLEYIDWFDARGKKRLFAADHLQSWEGKYLKYSIDIWAAKDDRILVRFHTKAGDCEDDDEAYEIKGIKYSDIPLDEIGEVDEMGKAVWVPKSVFDEFESWAYHEMPFVVGSHFIWRLENIKK